MTNTQKIRAALEPLIPAIQRSWNVIKYDAGYCTARERAELTLDRLDGPDGKAIDAIIAEYGYGPVEQVVSTIL